MQVTKINKVSIKTLKVFSIIIILFGMVMPALAVPGSPPNTFYGSVILNGEPAPSGTTIEAFIDGISIDSVVVQSEGIYGHYSYLSVEGVSGSVISFKVNGIEADQTAVWMEFTGPQKLDLTASGLDISISGDSSISSDDNISDNDSISVYDSSSGDSSAGSSSSDIGNNTDTEISSAQTTVPDTISDENTDSSEEENQTPGFGMIFAIAGLLSVIYLIKLSRK